MRLEVANLCNAQLAARAHSTISEMRKASHASFDSSYTYNILFATYTYIYIYIRLCECRFIYVIYIYIYTYVFHLIFCAYTHIKYVYIYMCVCRYTSTCVYAGRDSSAAVARDPMPRIVTGATPGIGGWKALPYAGLLLRNFI